jgi:hypothetical protein
MASPTESYVKLIESDVYKKYYSSVLVYDESDRPMAFGRGLCVSMPRLFFNCNKHVAIPYWNTPTDVYSRSYKALEKKYRISFRGNSNTHKVRKCLKEIVFQGYHFSDTADDIRHDSDIEHCSYVDLLLKSDWSLCPRGNGTSSFRLYESLVLGVPPIVVSNQFVPPKLLVNVDVRYMREQNVSARNLIALMHVKPADTKPISRSAIATNFWDEIRSFSLTNHRITRSYLQLNRAAWKLFRNLV